MTRTLNSNINCNNSKESVKFLYSYNGKILPRSSDGQLRYVGGHTRVLSVSRSFTFAELMVKFAESCGSSMNLKCKLPSEDLDVLVSVKSDEDLKSVIEEYDKVSPESKIRAVLFPINSTKKISPPSSPMSCFDFPSAPKSRHEVVSATAYYHFLHPTSEAAFRFQSPALGYPIATAKFPCYRERSLRHQHSVPFRNTSS